MAVLYHIFRRSCNSGKSTITVRQQACFVRHSVHQAEGKTSSVGHIRQTPRPKIKWVCIHHVYKVNRQSQSPNTSPRCDTPHRDQKRKTHPPNRRDPQYTRPHAQVRHQDVLIENVRHLGYKKIDHSQSISAGRTTAPTPDRRNGLLSSKSSGDSSLKCQLLPRFSRSSSNAKHFWTYSATTPLRRPLPKLDRHRGVDPIAKGDDHIEVAMTSRHIRRLPNIFVCGKGFLYRWRLFQFTDLRIAQTN